MKVHIKNIEPAWVSYGLTVEIDDSIAAGMSDDEIRDLALERIDKSDYTVVSGPEVKSQIDGMDQEFEVTEIER